VVDVDTGTIERISQWPFHVRGASEVDGDGPVLGAASVVDGGVPCPARVPPADELHAASATSAATARVFVS
jgi:hypothetical protein